MILPSSVFLEMNFNRSSFLTSDGSRRKKQMLPPEIHSVLQALGFSFQVLLSACLLPEACELYCLLFKLFIILFSCSIWWHTPLFLLYFDCFVCVDFYYTGLFLVSYIVSYAFLAYQSISQYPTHSKPPAFSSPERNPPIPAKISKYFIIYHVPFWNKKRSSFFQNLTVTLIYSFLLPRFVPILLW